MIWVLILSWKARCLASPRRALPLYKPAGTLLVIVPRDLPLPLLSFVYDCVTGNVPAVRRAHWCGLQGVNHGDAADWIYKNLFAAATSQRRLERARQRHAQAHPALRPAGVRLLPRPAEHRGSSDDLLDEVVRGVDDADRDGEEGNHGEE